MQTHQIHDQEGNITGFLTQDAIDELIAAKAENAVLRQRVKHLEEILTNSELGEEYKVKAAKEWAVEMAKKERQQKEELERLWRLARMQSQAQQGPSYYNQHCSNGYFCGGL